jgi:hypothetical protein
MTEHLNDHEHPDEDNSTASASPMELEPSETSVVDRAHAGETWKATSQLPWERLQDTDNPDHIVRGVFLRELLMGRHGKLDPRGVRIHGARISGTLDLSSVKTVCGLQLVNCVFDMPVELRGTHLPWLHIEDTRWLALNADDVHVDGNVLLHGPSRASNPIDNGPVLLRSARIGGQLEVGGHSFTSTNGPALNGDGMHVERSVFLHSSFTTSGQSRSETVRLVKAKIGGQLDMKGARVINHGGSAFVGDRMTVENSVILRAKFVTKGVLEGDAAVRLVGAKIHGQLDMHRARVVNYAGSAFVGDRMTVDDDIVLVNARFRARRNHEGDAAVRLVAATAHAQLDMRQSMAITRAGSALDADRITVEGDAHLGARFRVAKNEKPVVVVNSVVRLSGARISGRMNFDEAEISHQYNGPLLNLENTHSTIANMPTGVVCEHDGHKKSSCPHPSRSIRIGGFTYGRLLGVWEHWLHLVRCHGDSYRPQPYQQLASARRAAGCDGDVRKILIDQQKDRSRRKNNQFSSALRRTGHRFWGVLAGYGYRAGRLALTGITILILISVVTCWPDTHQLVLVAMLSNVLANPRARLPTSPRVRPQTSPRATSRAHPWNSSPSASTAAFPSVAPVSADVVNSTPKKLRPRRSSSPSGCYASPSGP